VTKQTARQKLLTIGLIESPTTFNPLAGTTIWDDAVINLVYDTLAISERDDPYDPAPSLAVSWQWDNDEPKMRLKLREGVKWHDGSPLTAADVKFTFDIAKEFEVPKFFGNVFFIEEVRAVDNYTLDITFDETRATFIPVTCTHLPILPKHLWESVAEEARKARDARAALAKFSNASPIGTGPYSMSEFVPGDFVKLAPNRDYFAGAPKVDGILMKVKDAGAQSGRKHLDIYASEEFAFEALRSGELDYVAVHYPISTVMEFLYEPDPKVAITLNPTNGFLYLGFNCRRRPFDDKAFRRAVALLVDRERFCSEIYMGQSLPAYTLMPPTAPMWPNPETPALGRGWNEERRVREARDTLAEAGYSWRRGALVMPDGQPLWEIVIASDDRIMARKLLVVELENRIAELGVPVRHAFLPSAQVRAIEHGWSHEFDMVVSEFWFDLPLDPDFLCSLFHSTQSARGFNSSGYANPEFDEVALQQRVELDRDKRKKQVWKMQDILAQDVPWIPITSNIRIEFYRSDSFRGWVKRPKGLAPYFQKWSYLELEPLN